MVPRLLVCLAFLPALPLPAQATIIVDPQNRPGAQFTTFQAAIDAANPGDRLVLRDGNYSGISVIEKSLSVFARPGAVLLGGFILQQNANVGLWIRNLGPSDHVAVRGLTFGEVPYLPITCRVENCAGMVELEDFVAPPQGSTSTFPQLEVLSCARVAVARCDFRDRGRTSCTDSTVTLRDSVLAGCNQTGGPIRRYQEPGLVVTGGNVTLSRCQVSGGSGYGLGWSGQPGLTVYNAAVVTVTGEAGTTITAGGSDPSFPISAIYVSADSTLLLDPIVTVVPNPGAPAVVGVNVNAHTPSLAASAAALGSPVALDLVSEPGASYFGLLGFPGAPLPLFGGRLWIDPILLIPIATGTLDAGGAAAWSLALPSSPQLAGIVLAHQALVVTSAGPRLSNPAEHVLSFSAP